MRLIFTLLVLIWTLPSFAQFPTDNPYRTKYNTIGHWTDSLAWWNVTDATQFGVYPNDNVPDDTSLARVMAQVALNGGGVVYLPAGQYDFLNSLAIPSKVILRGETPTGITNAKTPGYEPQSKLVFPRYVFDSLANGGNGTANNTAFKNINGADPYVRNAGLVNLDVNRAGIRFSSGTVNGQQTKNGNIIVFGVRSNNVSSIYSPVPDRTFQRPWQRHYDVFAANISTFVYQNAAICNNRCNDLSELGQDDSFDQEGYIVKKWPFTGYDVLTGSKARFDYANHYGIRTQRKGAPNSATPEQEPTIFAEGNEVRDNYIYKTMRVGLIVGGMNTIVKGNIISDKPNKVQWVHTVGTEVPKNSNTLENRGIDVSGWGIEVDSNDITVYRHRINSGPFQSVDGEGILHQACCGGTTVNDYRITNNTMNGAYIGIFFSGDIHNSIIKNNNLGGPNTTVQGSGSATVWVAADPSPAQPSVLDHVLVEGNYNADSRGTGFIVTGSKGGTETYAINNSVAANYGGANPPNMTLSCYVQQQNNTGFSAINFVGGNQCASPSYGIQEIRMIGPAADTTLCDTNRTPFNVYFRLGNANLAITKVNVYLGVTKVDTGLYAGPDSIITSVITPPPGNNTPFTVTAISYQNGVEAFSESRHFVRNCPVLVALPENKLELAFGLYPNPAKQQLSSNLAADLMVYDLLGRLAWQGQIVPDQQLDISGWQRGVYLVKARIGNSATKLLRLIKE